MAEQKPVATTNPLNAANPVKNSGRKVTIACKLPNGFVLQLAKPAQHDEMVMGGGTRPTTVFHRYGPTVTVFGPAHPQNAAPLCPVVGGYALTENVDGEFWDEWLKHHGDHPAVVNKLLLAYETTSSTRDAAKDMKAVRSGLERLDPKNLPTKGVKPVTVVQPQTEEV